MNLYSVKLFPHLIVFMHFLIPVPKDRAYHSMAGFILEKRVLSLDLKELSSLEDLRYSQCLSIYLLLQRISQYLTRHGACNTSVA